MSVLIVRAEVKSARRVRARRAHRGAARDHAACSGRRARARARCSAWSPGWSAPTAARSRSAIRCGSTPRRDIDVPVDRRRIAYVFQSLALFPHLDAIHNVEYGMARAVPRPERHARAEKLLARLGVGAPRAPPAAHLLGRRGAAGRARPRARDGAARDPARRAVLGARSRAARAARVAGPRPGRGDRSVPLLHVTHSMGEARALADRVIRNPRQGGRHTGGGPGSAGELVELRPRTSRRRTDAELTRRRSAPGSSPMPTWNISLTASRTRVVADLVDRASIRT